MVITTTRLPSDISTRDHLIMMPLYVVVVVVVVVIVTATGKTQYA